MTEVHETTALAHIAEARKLLGEAADAYRAAMFRGSYSHDVPLGLIAEGMRAAGLASQQTMRDGAELESMADAVPGAVADPEAWLARVMGALEDPDEDQHRDIDEWSRDYSDEEDQ